MSWHHVNSRGTELDRAYILRISEAAVSIALNPRFPPKTYVPRNVYLERRSRFHRFDALTLKWRRYVCVYFFSTAFDEI